MPRQKFQSLRPFDTLRAVSTVERLETEQAGAGRNEYETSPAMAGLRSSGPLFLTG